MTRVASASTAPGRGAPRPRSRGSRAASGLSAAGRRWRAGWRPCAASPVGASSASSGLQAAVRRRTAPPADSSSSIASRIATCSGFVVHLAHRHLVRAPGAFGPLAVDLLRDRSSPSGVRSTIIGQRGRVGDAAARARRSGCARISSTTASSVRGHQLDASPPGRRPRRSAACSRSRAKS